MRAKQKRIETVTLRLTPREMQVLVGLAEKYSMSRGEVVGDLLDKTGRRHLKAASPKKLEWD